MQGVLACGVLVLKPSISCMSGIILDSRVTVVFLVFPEGPGGSLAFKNRDVVHIEI